MICEYTVKTYCCDDISKIENYYKAISDNTRTWVCHHRLESHNSDNELRLEFLTTDELIALNMYYNRPASELIFYTKHEHMRIHSSNITKETRVKRSKSFSGENNPNYGVKFSKEHCEKLSKSHLGKKPWNFGKKMISDNMRWYNDGVKMIRSCKCPEGFVPGRLKNILDKKAIDKIMFSNRGTKWYNNGVVNTKAKKCPEGFVPGRLPLKKEHGQHISESNKGMKFWNNGEITIRDKVCPPGFVHGILKIK